LNYLKLCLLFKSVSMKPNNCRVLHILAGQVGFCVYHTNVMNHNLWLKIQLFTKYERSRMINCLKCRRKPYNWGRSSKKYTEVSWYFKPYSLQAFFHDYFCRIIGQNPDIQSITPSVWNQYMNKHEDLLDIFQRSLQIVRIY